MKFLNIAHMKKVKYIVALTLGLFLCMSVDAQRQQSNVTSRQSSYQPAQSERTVSQRNRVQYLKNFMKQEGDSLIIDMDIDMSKMDLATNHAQILTPVIASTNEEIELPKVMIQGTTRNKAFIRELELNDQAYEEFENNLPYAIVKPKGKLNYHISVPYEPWMADAALDIEEDLCGCGNQAKIARSRIFDGLTKDIIAEPLYNIRPQLA